ncbi:translation initiation factor IF-2 subunit beta [Salinigranum rubrum]|uniref:Translation initiation factor IF-2 subunit beta n=1 Tax=Salinigranum rubrum TaxID=755307 RepID=A0A2I8VLQ0_9EURY|nr:translation initiation factor IF-2 subunit beta [Salinigranum rubrum]AUV82009.1 translation initiation factor IF-2 subunit beta [Salinigranum rubrum]
MDYDDALNRGLERAPDIEEADSRYEVPEASVRPEGNVTVYQNFQATVDHLARDAEHVLKFLQSELGTAARIDEAGRARLTGSFKQSRVQNAMESYAEGFVRCSECGLPDTRLVTENGATVLKCDACGALSAVPDA